MKSVERTISNWKTVKSLAIATLLSAGAFPTLASAIQFDWNGQFWFENQWLNNYQLDRGRPGYDADQDIYNRGGPYVPGTGEKNVVWYSAFFKLKPKLVVNDSIQIRSEWHVGSPIYGFLGRNFPSSAGEQFNLSGSQRDNASLTVARFWANLVTDFGTVEVGRAPIHWGLGAIWNSGDNLFERYQSTGDLVRLTSKFGNLSVSPAISKVAMGGNAAGAYSSTSSFPSIVNPRQGSDDVTDYHLTLKYANNEEDFDFGLMWTRRTGNQSQTSLLATPTANGSNRLNFNILDFYARKKWGRFTFGGEVPLFTGTISGIDGSGNDFEYKSVAVIFETSYTSDSWDIALKAGHIPGQPSTDAKPGLSSTTNTYIQGTRYQAIYLHRNYGLGLIMFHYNLFGLAANNPDIISSGSLRSPYDNPLTNANYLSISPTFKLDKWSFNSTFVAAWADASVEGNAGLNSRAYYNHSRHQFFLINAGSPGQNSFYGWEVDLGAKFKWDENFSISWTGGIFVPGAYWEFTNTPNTYNNTGSPMFASQVQAGISF